MTQIVGLTSSPLQTLTVADPNTGNPISITLRFQPRTQEWYIGISFGTWKIANLKLTYSPNVLMQYSNIIPFGLLVATADQFDPFLINDFVSGRASLILLTSAEVADIAAGIAAGTILG